MNTKQLENYYAKNKQCQKNRMKCLILEWIYYLCKDNLKRIIKLDTYAKTTIP